MILIVSILYFRGSMAMEENQSLFTRMDQI